MGEKKGMKEKKSYEDVRNKGRSRSLRSYASHVFQESSVGLVSSLAQTSSSKRRVFKVLALIACLTGFLYQTGRFLEAVFQYPTSVQIDVIRPDAVNVPALTFCNNNGINRKMFCEKYPDKCETSDEELCEKFEYYCDENRTLVPKKEVYSLPYRLSLEEMVNLNVNVTNFAYSRRRGKFIGPDLTGPFLRSREFFTPKYLCYSLHDRVNSYMRPQQYKFPSFRKEPMSRLVFDVQPYDVFLPGTRPGLLFAIHSPFEAVNPLETGIFMEAGKTYMVSVSVEEEIRQEPPYDTKCINYSDRWVQNGRSGPRREDMCKQDCVADISMQCYNCIYPTIYYPRDERYCEYEDISNRECPGNTAQLMGECRLKCREDCRKAKYSYTVQERFSQRFNEFGEEDDDIDHSVTVEVFIEGDEMIILKHSPKYMTVEVFSNIGGFIGCWLGINLLDITDIVEGFFRIFRHSFKKVTFEKR